MEENKLINKNENNIFIKILNYFKNLFYKPKKESIFVSDIKEDNKKIDYEKDPNEFLKSLKVDEVMDYFVILDLQNRLEKGQIKEEDLTDEEYEAVVQKYLSEIEELKEKIYKRKVQLGMAS